MQKKGISSSLPILVIIGTLIVGLGSGLVLSLTTFGIASTTTIIITQTKMQTEFLPVSNPTTVAPVVAPPSITYVSIPGETFSPQEITVIIGTNNTVMWKNADTEGHTVTASDSSFDSGMLNPGQSFQYTFTTPGTFYYTCLIHPWMDGVVIVKSD